MRKLLLMGAIFLSQLVTTQVQAIDIEARVAYFYPQDKRVRDVFGKNGWPEYQLEVSTPLDFLGDCCCNTPFVGFFNASYFEETGHVRCRFDKGVDLPQDFCNNNDFCKRNKSRIEHWLLTGGLKYYFDCFECVRPYLGFGIGAGGVRVRDHFRNLNGPNVVIVDEEINEHHRNRDGKWGFAILAKSGIEYDITCNFFLDGFIDYSYTWFEREHKRHCESSHRLDTGGIKIGLGLGYRF